MKHKRKTKTLKIILTLLMVFSSSFLILPEETVEAYAENSTDSEAITVTFHRNFSKDDSTTSVQTFHAYDSLDYFEAEHWTRKGYTFEGWSQEPDSKEASYGVHAETTGKWLKKVFGKKKDLYAVWNPVNEKYGNIIFIGDSYVAASNWPQYAADTLGIGHNYTLANMGGTGFTNMMPDHHGNLVDFSTLLGYARDEIDSSDWKNVKYIVVCGGYNDITRSKETVLHAVNVFITASRYFFPNAKLLIGMVGWNRGEEIKWPQPVNYDYLPIVADAYKTACEQSDGYAYYMDNVQYLLRWVTNDPFKPDGIHPTKIGGYEIGWRVASSIEQSAEKENGTGKKL